MYYRWVGLVIVMGSFAIGWFWLAYKSAVDSALTIDETVLFEINKGDSYNHVINRLSARGLVGKPKYLKLFGKIENAASQLKAGEYQIVPGTTARELLAMMLNGDVHQYSLTLIEGWTFRQVLDELKETPNLSHTLKGKNHEEIMALVVGKNEHPEGRFFPDTYFFSKDRTDLTILQRAYKKMEAALASQWGKRDKELPLGTPYEALILASIVEKETARAEERPIIAGVFTRRLKKEIRLQTDPTVIYGMGERFNGNITHKDLRADTPYNTYLHKGLPPTPIAMPGEAAINAVLHPGKGESLYFVSRGDGTHVFSNTLIEHNRAVAIFQKRKK